MSDRKNLQNNCVTCAVASARRRLAGRRRPVGRARIARLVRHAGLAVAIGAAAAVPIAELLPAPRAEALSLPDLPRSSFTVPSRQPGYQLATVHGDVVPFGAAASGTAPSDGLANPVVAVARTRSGAGAWLTASDGGVFAFGDARWYGALSGTAMNAPVVELVPTPTGRGYWLATADGGVFTFGDATFRGSITHELQAPVTGMTTSPTGRGYWLAATDGGVFTFGDARYHGRPDGKQLRAPVVGIASSRSGHGYWMATADGGVFTFGDAPFLGSTADKPLGKVVGIAAGLGRPVAKEQQSLPRRVRNRYGNDISWPQCDGEYPAPGYGHAVVGVTGGRPFTENRCLASQWQWAVSNGSGGAVYVNLASPRQGDAPSMSGPAGSCDIDDLPCQTYNHSANNMTAAMEYARSAGVDSPMWWLDVEWLNRWTKNQALNALTVRAATETLQKAGLEVGVYSTALQWRTITGGVRNGLPVWIAGSPDDATSPSWCDREDKDFTGGGIWLVQSLPIRYDVNYACAPVVADPESAFRFRG